MSRVAFQTELYGLTQNQRNSGATTLQTALASETVTIIEGPTIDANKTVKGAVCLFCEVTFSARASADRVFSAARSWAATRATDGSNGRHSYVRVRELADDATEIRQLYSESPGWVDATTVEPQAKRA